MSWRDSLALGTLMNTRGLMELIVLNVGYELGILSPALFSMMVMMALVTTAMTAPLLSRLVPDMAAGPRRAKQAPGGER
jgi:Kef-type K+ transport system membrane component KefB